MNCLIVLDLHGEGGIQSVLTQITQYESRWRMTLFGPLELLT